MAQSMLAVEVSRSAGTMAGNGLSNARPVVLMQPVQPLVWRHTDFCVFVPEHRLPARRPVDLVRCQVPIPQSIVRPVDGKRVALLALAQALDDAFVREVCANS